MEKEFESIGYYEPGFIHLRINTDQSLSDINKLKEDPSTIKYFSNFFHEYIHFLQDLTTTHGLLNFINAIEYLRNSNKVVLEKAEKIFDVPLKLDNTYNIFTNIELRSIYYGDRRSNAKSVTYQSFTSVNQNVIDAAGVILTVPKYIVKYFDNGAQTNMQFHFGSLCIKEYMAHALQNTLFPDTIHDDIPYSIVELIVRKEYPPLANEKSFMVALCDISLMGFHPAQFFFFILNKMNTTKGWSPKDVDSIYEFAYSDLTFNHNGQIENVYSLYDKINNTAFGCFKDSLQAEVFEDNVVWFEEILKEAKKLRFYSIGFFDQLIQSPGILSSNFLSILKNLGSPFMTNSLNHGFFMTPENLKSLNIQPYFPKVFQSILRTYSGHKSCSLYDFCNSREDMKITNEKCISAPWLRIHDPDGCPYAQIWHTWGLDGVIPVINQT
ncbi:MAG: hypothetical protein K2Q22_08505 [Cytophagales bacterium]|nr:hypothetical protein [Cytophagales bacterium]